MTTTVIEFASTELTLCADVTPGTRPSGFDPGAPPEVEIVSAYRTERGRRVAIDLDALHAVIGDEGWERLQEELGEAAGEQDEGDPWAEDRRGE